MVKAIKKNVGFLCVLLMVAIMNTSTMAMDRIVWKFDEFTGVLSIEGVGAIPDTFKETLGEGVIINTPWREFYEDIEVVKITEGITSIGQLAFGGCTSLRKIEIPDSVIEINNYALPRVEELDGPLVVYGKAMSVAEAFATKEGYVFSATNEQLIGDINANGIYEAEDALSILKMVVGLNERYGYSADMNQNGEVEAGDALEVLKKVVSL